jgi:hypothetical protein
MRSYEVGLYNSQSRVIGVRNDSGEEIPPYACVQVVRMIDLNVFSGIKPQNYGSQYSHFANGARPITNGGYGELTDAPFMAMAIDPADGIVAPGMIVGPRSNGWMLRRNTGGFRVVSYSEDGTWGDGIAIVVRQPMLTIKGTLNADGSVRVYWGLDAGTDTGIDVDCYNHCVDTETDKKVIAVWQQESQDYDGNTTNGQWMLVAGEKPTF